MDHTPDIAGRARSGYAHSPMKDTLPPAEMLWRWTRAEYDRLIELGAFQSGERLELIDGFLVLREPQGVRHATGIRRVLAALRRALGPDWQIDSQLPLALDATSEPEPDVSVVAGNAGTYRDAHPARPLLVVEVADSSYRIDHEFKTSLYARAAVPECWVVDLQRAVVEVHRTPEQSETAPYGWRYTNVDTVGPASTITPLLAPRTAIAVADLLP
jgi:Uma2 family endonuclease